MYKPLAVIFMIIGFLLGCQKTSQSSYIVIAADHLNFQDSNCSRDWPEHNSGMSILCREAVRWTHAYTTSVLSGPALSSILTGLYPLQTGYHHPGQYLSPQFKNIAQVAIEHNYRTAFFSGGAPIFKKSGLDSGFEFFDDILSLNANPYFKPFRQNLNSFYEWSSEIGHSPFFATFYVPDMRFTYRTTTTLTGETRNKSYESQLEEFDSSLFDLITKLKREGSWDNTHFILVGLQGRNLYDRRSLSPNLNLHSENSQVALLWKPAQKKRDSPLSWTVDQNVSLADIGHTLFDLFGEKSSESQLSTISLANTLLQPQSNFIGSRLLLIESAWGEWHLGINPFYAILNDDELYFHTNPPVLYRTLSDHLEINPVKLQLSNSSYTNIYLPFADKENLKVFYPPSLSPLSLWNLTEDDWAEPNLKAVFDLYHSVKPQNIPPEARAWYARSLIENSDWKELKVVAEKWNNLEYMWLAHKYLPNFRLKKEPPCFLLLHNKMRTASNIKKCHDPLFLETLYALDDKKSTRKWEKIIEDRLIMAQILKANRALGSIWDVTESESNVLSLSEILFRSPEYKNKLRIVRKNINSVELESP